MSGRLLCLTRAEREILLGGLPHAAVVLYLWLRERMTWATRMVGADPKARINWQAATEALAIEWRPGLITPCSYEQARRAGRQLVRRGLVLMWSNAADRILIFECVFAPKKSSVQKQADRSKRPKPTDPTPRKHPPSRQIKNEQADRHLDVVSTGVHHNARAKNSAVDNSGAGELFYPPLCSFQMNRTLRALIEKSNANGSAQPMLDELAARMERRNPLLEEPDKYLAALIAADSIKKFEPSNGALKVAQRRAEAEQTHRNIAAPHKPTTAGRELARAALALARKKKLH